MFCYIKKEQKKKKIKNLNIHLFDKFKLEVYWNFLMSFSRIFFLHLTATNSYKDIKDFILWYKFLVDGFCQTLFSHEKIVQIVQNRGLSLINT